jgi:hypothetical protein
MSEEKSTLREALRASKGIRIEAKRPEPPRLNRVLNEYMRSEAKKSVTHVPLNPR